MTQFLSTKNIQYNVGDHQLIEVEIEVEEELLHDCFSRPTL